MNLLKRITSNKTVPAILLCVLFSTNSFAVDNINGNACVAANLNQAFELQWNQARVLNPASNPNTRFVTCTNSTGGQWLNETDTGQFTSVEAGSVTAFFSSGAAPGAEVACIFREVAASHEGNAGNDSFAVVITADDALPDTNTGNFDAGDNIDLTLASYTVTCSLDPGTGINSYNSSHSVPTP